MVVTKKNLAALNGMLPKICFMNHYLKKTFIADVFHDFNFLDEGEVNRSQAWWSEN